MAWSWSVCGTAKVVWKPVAVLHWITLRARPSMSAMGPSPFHFSHSFCARHLLSKQGRQFANSPHNYMIDNRKPLSSADFIFSSACAALQFSHRFSMGFRSGEFSGQSSTPTPWSFNQLFVLLAVWAGAKSCWKMKHEVLQTFLVNGYSDVGFQKTQWTNTSRWHYTPNHHRLWKFNTGLQATWAMSFSTLPPDFRTLVSKLNTKLALIWKEDFGPLGNSPVLLLFSPGKTPLTTTVAKFLDTYVCGGSWCLEPSLSPFLVKFT